ncbi:MAG: hypothetical protein WD738_15780 [Pirellulales bacterium]
MKTSAAARPVVMHVGDSQRDTRPWAHAQRRDGRHRAVGVALGPRDDRWEELRSNG